MRKMFLGELIAEAVAMFIIIAFGDAVACMYVLYTPSPYQQAYWGVCIAWGLAVTIAIYTTASVSGCHANPAVTFALALYRKFPWRKVIPYCIAQTAGAFLGAVIVYILYAPVIDHFNLENHFTRGSGGAAGCFFTHPGLAITPMHAFSD
jgi:glycerol uptake facilitator protein